MEPDGDHVGTVFPQVIGYPSHVHAFRPPSTDLPGPDRQAVATAVLVRGCAVEDQRLAPDAVELARWFDRRITIAMVLWGILTASFGFAAVSVHSTFLWILTGCGLLLLLGMTIPKRRYRRALRDNTPLVDG